MDQKYRVCSKCIMDTTDPNIRFDGDGVCNYCRGYEAFVKTNPPEDGKKSLLAKIAHKIKIKGQGKEYDCLIGLSGGIDSSYLAFKVKELGLRPLAVHFDSGWNSELAVNNIENIVKKLNLDLHTVVCDWEEMKDLQRAFFLASVVNCDIPQDHAFIAALFWTAIEFDIQTIIGGHNSATEFVMARAWRGHDSRDWGHIQGISQKFGKMQLQKYPHFTFFQRFIYYPYIKKIKFGELLEFMPYVKKEAREILEKEIGWRDYGGKHCESRFTRFFQGYYLPEKYGYDKRKAHLSSLIVSGQMTRDEALEEIKNPVFTPEQLIEEKAFILKKLGFSEEEWEKIMALPHRTYKDFPTDYYLYHIFKIRPFLGKLKRSLLRA